MKWLTRISLFLFLIAPLGLLAQYNPAYELPIDYNDNIFHIEVDNEQNFLLYTSSSANTGDYNLWKFIKIDTALNEEWRQEIIADSEFNFIKSSSHGSQVYFLFAEERSFNFEVINVNTETGFITKFTIRNHIPIAIDYFLVSDESVVVGGLFRMIPVVLYFDRSVNKSFFLPNIFSNEGKLCDITLNSNKTFDVLTKSKEGRQHVMVLYTFDHQGKLIGTRRFVALRRDVLQDGKIATHNKTKYVVGTYGKRGSYYSKGIFIADLSTRAADINYTGFGKLDNFFNYMSERKLRRVQRRIARREAKEKEYKFKCRMKLNDVVATDDEIVLIGESFYPKYKIIYSNYYGFQDDMQVFDGYEFIHSVIVGFKPDLSLAWDNYLKIEDVKLYTLENPVKFSIGPENILLFYNSEDAVNVQKIKKQEIVDGGQTVTYKTDKTEKNNEDLSIDGVIHSNNDVFYAYGVKNVVDTGTKDRKKVFFINKVINK